MNARIDKNLFFSMTKDYIENYIPTIGPEYKATQESYRDALTIFRRYLTDDLKIKASSFKFSDLSYDFVLDYRIALSKKYATATVNHRLAALKAYVEYAANRLIELEPIHIAIMKVPQLKVTTEIRTTIDDENLLKEYLDAPSQSDIGVRDRVILNTLYDTAIRVEELARLDLIDVCIHYEVPYLNIQGKGGSHRRVCLNDNTVSLIQQYIGIYHPEKINCPFLYTIIKGHKDRMSIRNIQRIVRKYADIVRKRHPEFPENVYPHMLRRTRITDWYDEGISIEVIAELAGHKHTATTKKHYAKPSMKVLRSEAEKGSDVIPGPKEKPLWEDDEEFSRFVGLR